jgi:hypothetical protein
MGAPLAMKARTIMTSGTVSYAPPVWPDSPGAGQRGEEHDGIAAQLDVVAQRRPWRTRVSIACNARALCGARKESRFRPSSWSRSAEHACSGEIEFSQRGAPSTVKQPTGAKSYSCT